MELLFVYIENYKNIVDKGFNFCSEYHFEVEKKGKELILSITKTDNVTLRNFFGESILNVTAIIGENGTGKSNLLEALRSESERTLTIWRANNSNFYYSINNLRRRKKLKLIVPREYESSFVTEHEPITSKSVYYSPLFDMRNYPFNVYPKDIDISTNYLLYKDAELQKYGKTAFDQVTFHKLNDILRQIEIVYSNILPQDPDKGFVIKQPTEIEIISTPVSYANSRDEEWNLDSNSKAIRKLLLKMLNDSIHELLYKTKSDTSKLARDKASVIKGKRLFQRSLLDSFFYNRNQTNHFLDDELGVDREKIEKLELDEALKFFALNQNWINKEIFSGFFDSINILFVETLKEKHNYEEEPSKNAVTIPLSSDSFLPLFSYQENYLKEISETNNSEFIHKPFDFQWRDMSSGEKSFLNLFSRLLFAKNQLVNAQESPDFGRDSTNIDFLTIYIDEGEMGFHPDWQKKYLKAILEFIPICFYHPKYLNNTRFQIILTSHSPFIVSDLPKENIIFLERDETGNCVVSNLKKHSKTFGANIHELFTDSFFLHDGLLGEFARNKITTLIDFLKSNKKIDEENQMNEASSSELINLIGEPLIKDHLMDMWEQKFSKDDNRSREELIKEIESLKEKIKFSSL